MKKVIISITLVLILCPLVIYYFSQNQKINFNNPQKISTKISIPMTITSPAFAEGQAIPRKYSCDGDGVNPPLEFNGVPSSAQSLALLVDDPDAPNGTWVHWLVWNIAPGVTSVAENSVPEKAIQGQGSSGQNVFGGPCPPNGLHHYHFKLFALDSMLTIPPYSDVAAFTAAINGHIVSSAELIGTYNRGQ